MTPPKPYSDAVFIDASKAPLTAARAVGQLGGDAAEGAGEHQQDAGQQRPLD